jgi:hypothetical protein
MFNQARAIGVACRLGFLFSVASGGGPEECAFGTQVLHKEMFLTPEDLAGLGLEQQAAVDFLVLLRSERFVGHGVSTFSQVGKLCTGGVARRCCEPLVWAVRQPAIAFG